MSKILNASLRSWKPTSQSCVAFCDRESCYFESVHCSFMWKIIGSMARRKKAPASRGGIMNESSIALQQLGNIRAGGAAGRTERVGRYVWWAAMQKSEETKKVQSPIRNCTRVASTIKSLINLITLVMNWPRRAVRILLQGQSCTFVSQLAGGSIGGSCGRTSV